MLIEKMAYKNSTTNYLTIWAFVFLGILLTYRIQSYKNPMVFKGLETVEPMTDASNYTDSVEEIEDMSPADDTSVNKPREPYNLLNGVLPPSTRRVSPTSQRCYEGDFQTRLEKGGTYRQLTNNYKRAAPDSCSGPLHEFVLSYYTPPSI
jgi:hypothetical protein